MLTRDRLVRLLLCMAICSMWLAACDGSPTPQERAATAIPTEETQAVQPTTEVLPTEPQPPTATPTAADSEALPPRPRVDEPYYEDRSAPIGLLASYYNAINRLEYPRAWAYWRNPPNPSYEDFVQGFADTRSVLLTVRPPTWYEGAAGSSFTTIPTLLTAIHLDGSRHTFVGCFVVRRSNVGEPGVEQDWSLYEASINPTEGYNADLMQLAQACESVLENAYNDRSDPVHLLASYYNAINLGEYSRAWEYWGNPPSPSFEEFVEGFADTESVMLVVRPPTLYEGAAGSVYVTIPALMSATHTDGSLHNFGGCFVARRPNLGDPGEWEWSLFDAAVQPTAYNTADMTVLDEVCLP